MDTAISLHIIGRQKEVLAEDFTKRRIYARGTFICPECGEDVLLRMSEKQKSYFAHYMNNEFSKDCDLRVDGKSNLTIYERLGVPLYLTKSKINGYELNIGLKSISNELLRISEKENAYLEVIFGKNSRKINIDRFNFLSKELNLFKIDHYPAFEKPFVIRYRNLPPSINKWSDFIDPVLEAGILFSVNSNIGKSIRHGDTIYSDEEYLWLSPKKLQKDNILEKNTEFAGEILLNNKTHYIYKVVFIKNEKDISNFEQLSKALHQNLKLVLLESKNKINFLWPPSIKTKEGYIVSTKGRVHNVVHSANNNPHLYMYNDDGYREPKKLKTTYHQGTNYLNYNLLENEIHLNMDRKITSTGMNISFMHHEYTGEDIHLVDTKKNNELNQEYHIENLNFELFTNVKLNSLLINSKKSVNIRKYNTNIVNWREINFGDTIYLFNNDNLVTKIYIGKYESLIHLSSRELKLISQIPQRKVTLTEKNREKIYNILDLDHNFSHVFKNILKTNKIPYRIHQLLKEI
ncbi:hypothetical protein FPV24_05805 [Carnobacterium sp. PL24RED07]|uniref:competence protein CoiA family protein n=1 Tax=Lactobacillales TaxID=186826 RepID=UPI0011EEE9A2|nr:MULTISPECIES: hypothetical protein [unclassified Carnobacterium]KAF3301031.1 hypothetical protein FPV22_05850 [Carnobacterium sp. PL26RED25]KAF3305405.1 hypothetical protein FPV24_05805 [Carnobacterium sp. PL24RED07]